MDLDRDIESGPVEAPDPVQCVEPEPVRAVEPEPEPEIDEPVEAVESVERSEPQAVRAVEPEPEIDEPAKRTRRTGVDRDISQEILKYLKSGNGPIGQNKVRERFVGSNGNRPGKSLLVKIYDEAEAMGYIYREGRGKPWKRSSERGV